MPLSASTGWIALGLLPTTALMAVLLRRLRSGSLVVRMRPHFIAGYAALAFAVFHLTLSGGGMSGANPGGIWLATFATAGLAAQAFSGASLQAPGTYRKALRRWHVFLFWLVSALTIGHIVMNG